MSVSQQTILNIANSSGELIATLSFRERGLAMAVSVYELSKGNVISLYCCDSAERIDQFDSRIPSLRVMQ